ncbi:MAG: glycosyltransferase family 4 protein [Proteobacteria bacterium]|nr:glycosyltransferase family 4 protein [Pseudomonadota bacterium]
MKSLTLFSASMGCQYGGTETYVQTLARQLLGEIADVRLVTGGKQNQYTEDYNELLRTGNFHSCCFPMLDRHSLLGRMLSRSRLGTKIGPTDIESFSALASWRKIKGFVTDTQLLEAHYPLDGLLFPLLPREVKKILHFHGAWPPPLFRKLWKYILRHTDCCIACSSYARDELLKVMPSATIEVVYNGVDVDKFSPGHSSFNPACTYDPGHLKVGTVARLSHDKGSDLLCRVAGELRGEVELFLAGPADSGFSGELKKMADAPNIHHLGPIPHSSIPDFYRFLDCFVLPSRFEAFPLTILEAMASGCAVIATRVGGIPEMIGVEDKAGLLFSVGDTEALKAHLRLLRADHNICHHLREQGRARVVGNFSLQRTVAMALAIYQQTLAGSSGIRLGQGKPSVHNK